jgi:hypothetical protein
MVDTIAVKQAELEQEEAVNTAEPAQVNKARKKAARTRADRLRFIKAAMQHEEGRAWFCDIINRCRVFDNAFYAEETHNTAFRLGEQNIGKMIFDDIIEAAPELYVTMISEGKKR